MAEISKSIEQLEKEVLDKNNEISRLKSLQEKFPDLESYTNRWKKVRYTSKLVNNIVTDCEIYHGCGCCNDSPLKISPYIKTEFGNVYSSPCEFIIGEKYWDGGDEETPNWQNILIKENIPEAIIKIAEVHFKNNMPYYKLQQLVNGEENESE